jgi:hypothetical protein
MRERSLPGNGVFHSPGFSGIGTRSFRALALVVSENDVASLADLKLLL